MINTIRDVRTLRQLIKFVIKTLLSPMTLINDLKTVLNETFRHPLMISMKNHNKLIDAISKDHYYIELDDELINIFHNEKILFVPTVFKMFGVTPTQHNFDILWRWIMLCYKHNKKELFHFIICGSSRYDTHRSYDTYKRTFNGFIQKFLSVGCTLSIKQFKQALSIELFDAKNISSPKIICCDDELMRCSNGINIILFFNTGNLLYIEKQIKSQIKLSELLWQLIININTDMTCDNYPDDIIYFFKESIFTKGLRLINVISRSKNVFLQSIILLSYTKMSLRNQLQLINKDVDLNFLEHLCDTCDLYNNVTIDHIMLIYAHEKIIFPNQLNNIITKILMNMHEKNRVLFESTRCHIIDYLISYYDIDLMKKISNYIMNTIDIHTLKLACGYGLISLIDECANHKILPNDTCLQIFLNLERRHIVKSDLNVLRKIIKLMIKPIITQDTFEKFFSSNILNITRMQYVNKYKESHNEFVEDVINNFNLITYCIENGCTLTETIISHFFRNSEIIFTDKRIMKYVDELIKKVISNDIRNVKIVVLGFIGSLLLNNMISVRKMIDRLIKEYSLVIDTEILVKTNLKGNLKYIRKITNLYRKQHELYYELYY